MFAKPASFSGTSHSRSVPGAQTEPHPLRIAVEFVRPAGTTSADACNSSSQLENDTLDGKVLWETDTAKDFVTVNGVTANSGATNGPGPLIAGGMMFTNPGYGYLGAIGSGLPGNVLLAFGIE